MELKIHCNAGKNINIWPVSRAGESVVDTGWFNEDDFIVIIFTVINLFQITEVHK